MSAEPRRPRRRGPPISDSLGAERQALGGILASHARGLDAYLNRQAQRIDQCHHNLLADTTDASRSERLLLLLLDQLGVAPEAVQAARRGEDGGAETGAIHSEQRGAGDEQPRTSRFGPIVSTCSVRSIWCACVSA